MRCSGILPLLLSIALLFLSGCKNEIKPFDIPQTRATVSLPRPISTHKQDVPEDATVTVFAHEDQNGSYLVSAYPIPKRIKESGKTDKDRLYEASRAVKVLYKVPDDRWSPVELPPRLAGPGLEVFFDVPDRGQQARIRLYLIDGLLYTLTTVGTPNWVDSQGSRIFLTSLVLKRNLESGSK